MTDCIAADVLGEFLADLLANEARQRVAAHLETCPDCLGRLDALSEQQAASLPGRGPSEATSEFDAAVDEVLARVVAAVPLEVVTTTSSGHPRCESDESIQFPGACTSDSPLGQLEHYWIEQELGGGASGIVYRAYDSQLERNVAIKVLRGRLAVSASERTRLEREARAVASLSHDHIVTIHGFVNGTDFLPYLVMEYVDGENLAARIAREGPLEVAEAARIVRESALGLAAAAEAGLVHRDIKPSNILVDRRTGRAKITDFGLACAADSDLRQTAEGAIAGTPAYMSPEQIDEPRQIDERTDVYSLGVVLYELLTGEVPFRGVLRMTLSQVLHEEPRPPRQLNDAIPRDVETICQKAMAKDRRLRYESARALADDLMRWIDNQPIAARRVTLGGRLIRWCRRSPRVAGLSGIVLLLLTTIAIGSVIMSDRFARARDEARNATQDANTEKRHAAEQAEIALTLSRDLMLGVHEEIKRTTSLRRQQQIVMEASLAGLQSLAAAAPDSAIIETRCAEAHLRLGVIALRLGELERASARFAAAQDSVVTLLDREPENAELHTLAGAVTLMTSIQLVDEGEFETARQRLTSVIQRMTNVSDNITHRRRIDEILLQAHFELGEANYFEGRLAEALPHYVRSVDLAEKYRVAAATEPSQAASDAGVLFPGDTPFSEIDLDSQFSRAMIRFELGDLKLAATGFHGLLATAASLLDQRRELEEYFRNAEVEVDLHLLQDVIRAREYAMLAERFLAEIAVREGEFRLAGEHYRKSAEQAFAMQVQTGWNRRIFEPVTDIYVCVSRLTDGAGKAVVESQVVESIERFLIAYLAHHPQDAQARVVFAAALNALGIQAYRTGNHALAIERLSQAEKYAAIAHSQPETRLAALEESITTLLFRARAAAAVEDPWAARTYLQLAFDIVTPLQGEAEEDNRLWVVAQTDRCREVERELIAGGQRRVSRELSRKPY